MKKVAIYARQSLDKEDSFSIEKQIDDCKKRIGSDVPIQVFVDRGFSGKNTDRPSFNEMMNEVRDDKLNQGLLKNRPPQSIEGILRSKIPLYLSISLIFFVLAVN